MMMLPAGAIMMTTTMAMMMILHQSVKPSHAFGGVRVTTPPTRIQQPSSSSSISVINNDYFSSRPPSIPTRKRQQRTLVLLATRETDDVSSTAYNAPATPPPTHSHLHNNHHHPLKSGTMASVSTYKHLFRHVEDISMDCWLRVTEAKEFLLSVGYTESEIERLASDYPKLLDLSVHDQLAPKIRFLVQTLGGGTGGQLEWIEDDDDDNQEIASSPSLAADVDESAMAELLDEECRVDDVQAHHSLHVNEKTRQVVPASFFAQRLEKTMAPRHAYLQFFGLPHSAQDLLYFQNGHRLQQFLKQGCSTKPKTSAADFAQLCTKWASRSVPPMGGSMTHIERIHTAETVRALERAFSAGLLAATKNVETPDLELLDMTPGQLVELLVSHGANTMESDSHGVSLLHWAAGTGNLVGLQALLQNEVETTASLLHDNDTQDIPAITQVILLDDTSKDGSTPLHWAACGVGPEGFSSGGHADVCRYLLESVSSSSTSTSTAATDDDDDSTAARGRKVDPKAIELANARTDIGTTPLMLAAWSGSVETVQVLLEYGQADPHAFNVEGYTAAHFAASARSLAVCQYLHNTLDIDFTRATTNSDDIDREFTSPLQSAIAYDRKEVVEWIRETFPEAATTSSVLP